MDGELRYLVTSPIPRRGSANSLYVITVGYITDHALDRLAQHVLPCPQADDLTLLGVVYRAFLILPSVYYGSLSDTLAVASELQPHQVIDCRPRRWCACTALHLACRPPSCSGRNRPSCRYFLSSLRGVGFWLLTARNTCSSSARLSLDSGRHRLGPLRGIGVWLLTARDICCVYACQRSSYQ